MKNIQNKLILGIATLVAVFGFAGTTFAATAPIMSTSSATAVTTTSATLNGFYNDGGSGMTQIFFDYGTSPILGTLSPLATVPALTAGNYSVTISGLTPGTTYYVQAVGTNGIGSTWGNPTITFTTKTTSSVMPVMSTASAINIASYSATLNGFYNMNNNLGSVYFEYGTSSVSLSSTTSNISVSSNSGNYSANLSGLSPLTTYYYRAVGVNANGTTRATTVLSFTTLAGTYTPPTPTGNKCYISSFNANSYYITRGNTVYLSWNTTNCTNVTLSPSGYNALSASSYAVYPSANTNTYTLYASNSTSSDTSYITITTNNGGYNPNPNPYYPPNPPYYPPNPPYYPTGGGTTYRTYDYMYGTNGGSNTSTGTTNRIYNKVKSAFSGTNNADASSSSNTVTSNTTNSNSDSSSLSAAVGLSGGSFFPNTFFGWLILILIILVIAMIVRTVTKKKSAHVAHH